MRIITAQGSPDPDDDLPEWYKNRKVRDDLPPWLVGHRDEEGPDRQLRDPAQARHIHATWRARRHAEKLREAMASAYAEPLWSPTPIVGYRTWDVTLGGVIGRTGFHWTSPYLKAECPIDRPNARGRRGAPHRRNEVGCTGLCGVNAFRRAATLVDEAMRHPIGFSSAPSAFRHGAPAPSGAYGVVSMWGRVIEHRLGYRSEHALTVGIVLVTNNSACAIVGEQQLEAFFEDPFDPELDRDPISLDRADPPSVRHAIANALETIGETR